ncbi:MAG: phytanoyl-CoA dioxygenase family protein [Planctomycetota bacterium]
MRLRRAFGLFTLHDEPVPPETEQLQREGHALLRGVFAGEELRALREEIEEIYATCPGDRRAGIVDDNAASAFRYQMYNRSARCQEAMGHPRILEVIEPLLGCDCHAINSTAWRNPAGLVDDPEAYYFWHIDGGPYVPRPPGLDWPDAIPYPIFVIGSHIFLEDCRLEDGPTTVVPTSHRSGELPPKALRYEEHLEYRGHGPVSLVAEAGDVAFFVSDVWHRRRLPTADSRGRFFLQTNYGRRDIAQRILTTEEVHHASEDALARATTPRQRTLIGIHPACYYDG